MKKIKIFLLTLVSACVMLSFTACGGDDTVQYVINGDNSAWARYQQLVTAEVMAQKKHDKVILLVAFGSTWE
jgi:sirohydrochlorin cobaltochelatase